MNALRFVSGTTVKTRTLYCRGKSRTNAERHLGTKFERACMSSNLVDDDSNGRVFSFMTLGVENVQTMLIRAARVDQLKLVEY